MLQLPVRILDHEPEKYPEETVSTPIRCIDPADLKFRLDDVTVVDVRTPGEFESIHLPSSKNRPLDELDQHVDEIRSIRDAGTEVVLVCRSGARAHQAQEALAAAGVPDLPILEGGVLAWQAEEGDVVRDVLRWDLERQVRLVAGGIVAASVAISTVYPPARFVAGAVGAGMVAAATTNTCAMGTVLSKLPYNRSTVTTAARAA
jgi:rhodanese-related sulfurtransferase